MGGQHNGEDLGLHLARGGAVGTAGGCTVGRRNGKLSNSVARLPIGIPTNYCKAIATKVVRRN